MPMSFQSVSAHHWNWFDEIEFAWRSTPQVPAAESWLVKISLFKKLSAGVFIDCFELDVS